jgi:DNA helicase-2/ATP-dependent DNA helicase PcrA
VLCRVCGRTLSDAGEIKLMRCEDCPSDLDEGLYERLRAWRTGQARALGQPAYCVFTDKTLLAIAEVRPEGEAELASIPGVGVRKLHRFGADVLALVAGRDPAADAAGDPEDEAEEDAEGGPEGDREAGPEGDGGAEPISPYFAPEEAADLGGKSSAEEVEK